MTPGPAVRTAPAVLLDANAYRSTSDARFDVLLELEQCRQVARYAEPFSWKKLYVAVA